MEKMACKLVFGGIGAVVGAVLTSTPKGKIINENLFKAFELYDKCVSKHLPIDKIIGLFLEVK